MKILVTGANGWIGRALINRLQESGHEVAGTGRGPFRLPGGLGNTIRYYPADLLEHDTIRDLMEDFGPELVVHSAALTQVDYCELHQEEAFAINVTATEHLAQASREAGSRFLFLSTDFVFSGEKGNYRETDPVDPVNWYGQTKVQAEEKLAVIDPGSCIVRTCLVYGKSFDSQRSNIIDWVKRNLEAGQAIRVVSDQFRTPTMLNDLIHGIELCIGSGASGIFHISGADMLTPYDIARETARFLRLDDSLIEKVDASVFSQPGRRPLRTGFDISKARKELGYNPRSFRENLRLLFPENPD